LLLFWLGARALLLYLPYYQNRRFNFAAFVPIAILAVYALRCVHWMQIFSRRFAFVVLSALTNVIMLASVFFTIQQADPVLFMTHSEWEGVCYLSAHAPERAVVLASPEMGLLILTSSDLRVVYGHPAETPHAAATLNMLHQFFSGQLTDANTFLKPVDFIFLGPREKSLGTVRIPPEFSPKFSSGDVTIYARSARQMP
jgi:hypothetical protein